MSQKIVMNQAWFMVRKLQVMPISSQDPPTTSTTLLEVHVGSGGKWGKVEKGHRNVRLKYMQAEAYLGIFAGGTKGIMEGLQARGCRHPPPIQAPPAVDSPTCPPTPPSTSPHPSLPPSLRCTTLATSSLPGWPTCLATSSLPSQCQSPPPWLRCSTRRPLSPAFPQLQHNHPTVAWPDQPG